MSRRQAVLLVLAFGAIVGLLAGPATLYYVQPDYRADLAWDTRWISHPEPNRDHAYFRSRLHLRTKPLHAWIAVMAPDHFTLFVNGKRVTDVDRDILYVQQVIDITPHLRTGLNVIAIHNELGTIAQQARVAVQGRIVEPSGETFPIRSDGTWRVASRDESLRGQSGLVTEVLWHDPAYDDGRWPFAVEGDAPRERLTTAFEFPPVLVTEPPHAEWMWVPDAAAREAFFRVSVDAATRPRDAWLRVHAKRTYRLLVNGSLVAAAEDMVGTDVPDQDALAFYNVGPFLRAGENVFAVQASNERVDRRLFVDGFVEGADGARTWLGPGAWRASAEAVDGWDAVGFDASSWAPAPLVRAVTATEWAGLTKVAKPVDAPVRFRLRRLALAGALVVAAMAASLGLWCASAWVVARVSGRLPSTVRGGVALTFVAPALVLVAAFILTFDPRFGFTFAYQPRVLLGSVALLLLLHAGVIAAALLARGRAARAPGAHAGDVTPPPWWRDPAFLLVLALTAIGLALRFTNLTRESIQGDEATGLKWTLGLLERGYPSMVLDGRVKVAYTGELVYYFKAIGVFLFGPTAFGLRIADVVFGTLTIPLFYWVGRLLHGRRVGLLAAAVYTVLPSAIGMTHYGRYPSQLQFFALLTFGLLFRAMTTEPFRPARYYVATASFVATYLTWEGSAFWLPAVTLGMMMFTRPHLGWMRNGHVWTGVGLVSAVVVIQLSVRFVAQADWPAYGTGLQDVVFALMWRYPYYDPLFYLHEFFLIENNLLLSVAFALGIPLWFTDSRAGRALALMGTTLLVALALMTNLLEVGEWRYVNYLLPLLLLSACVVVVAFLDAVAAAAAGAARGTALAVRAAHGLTAALLVAGLVVFSTSLAVKLQDLPWANSGQFTNLDKYNNPTVLGAAEYVRQHWQPGDIVVALNPHVWQHYLGRADYFFENRLDQAVFAAADPRLPIHRYAGIPSLLSFEQLAEMRDLTPRVWYVSFGSEPLRRGRLVYQDWRSAVYLFGPPR